MKSLYLAVRGGEIVGILAAANGQVLSIIGMDYDMFVQEYRLVSACPECGEPFDPDEDDDEAFDPTDFH